MPEEKKIIMSREKFEELLRERDDIKLNRRKQNAQRLKEAKAQGDISENAEYDNAMQEYHELEAREEELNDLISRAEVLDKSSITKDTVGIGTRVKVLDVEFDEEEEYLIVGSQETNCLENIISNESPMGQALFGAKVGETRIVQAPGGEIAYKVLEISIAD